MVLRLVTVQLTSERLSNVAVNVPGLFEIPRVSIEWILGMLVGCRYCLAGKDAVNWVPYQRSSCNRWVEQINNVEMV